MMDELEALVEPEWLDWYRLTPQERWAVSERIWTYYLAIEGPLDPDPDPQSPFYDPHERYVAPAEGRPSHEFF